MDRIELLRELHSRASECDRRGDWRGVEIYTAASHHVLHAEPDARRIAARQAATPLDDRIIGTKVIPIMRVTREGVPR